MDFRELNYILIPRSADDFESWERSRAGRVMRPALWFARTLTWEGQIVFVAMLVAAAAGMDVTFSRLYLVFCGLVGLLVGAYAVRPFASLDGVEMHVEHPMRVVAGEAVPFTVVVRNGGRRRAYAVRVIGPFLPWDGQWITPPSTLHVIEAGGEARTTVYARFDLRGQRSLGRFAAASVWPMGLVMGRRVRSRRVVINVVPRIAPIEGLPVKDTVRQHHGGAAASDRAGESYELLGVRDYRPGDRVRDLHARSWARHGRPVVREFRASTSRRVGIVFHTDCPHGDRGRFEAAVQIVAGMNERLLRDEVHVELMVVGTESMTASMGAHASAIEIGLDTLSVVDASPALDAVQARAFVASSVYAHATVYFVFCGWDDVRAALVEEVRHHGVQARVLAVMPPRQRRGMAAGARAAGVRVVAPEDVPGPGDPPLMMWEIA